jgi:hypothetical protein
LQDQVLLLEFGNAGLGSQGLLAKLGAIHAVAQLGAPQGQAFLVDEVVHLADVAALDPADRGESCPRSGLLLVQGIEAETLRRHAHVIDDDRLDAPDERPPLLALQVEEVARALAGLHVEVADPAEVLVVEIVVADAIEIALDEAVVAGDLVARRLGHGGEIVGLEAVEIDPRRLARDPGAVLEGHHLDRLRPERRDAVPEDRQQEAADQDDAQRQRAAEGP